MIEFTLNGLCLEVDVHALILTGSGAAEVAARSKWPVLAHGQIDLHLGISLFDRPFVFTPTHIITERQQVVEGEAVFDWLSEGCYRMPRSEVFGRDVRGKAAQVFAREIDAEESPVVMLGHSTRIVAVIEIDPALGAEVQRLDRPELPDRWARAVKHYRAGPAIDWVASLSRWFG